MVALCFRPGPGRAPLATLIALAAMAPAGAAGAQGGAAWPPRIAPPPAPEAPPHEAPRPADDPSTWERPPDAGGQVDDDADPRRATGRRRFVLDVFATAAFGRALDVSDDLIAGGSLDLDLRHTFGFGARPRFFPSEAIGIGPYLRVLARRTLGVAGTLVDGSDYRLGAGQWWTLDVGPSAVGQVDLGPVALHLNLEGGLTIGIVDAQMDGFEADSELGFHVAASAGVRWWAAPAWSLFAELGVAYHSVEHFPDYVVDPGARNVVTPRIQDVLVTLQVGVGFGAPSGG